MVVVEVVEVLPFPREVEVGEEGEALCQPLCPLWNKLVQKIRNSEENSGMPKINCLKETNALSILIYTSPTSLLHWTSVYFHKRPE